MTLCTCGCGETVRKNRTFVNKEHQLAWMVAGGASEMNALLPDEVRVRGGQTTGRQPADSGRLREAGLNGAEASKENAQRFREQQNAATSGAEPVSES